MSSIYIKEFDELDFQFYRECFSDKSWRISFGESEEINNIDIFIADRIKSYPFVKRYIFLNREQERVAFIVADFRYENSQECIMGGGVAVNLINKGYGVKSCAVFCHYIFDKFASVTYIVAYYQNKSSYRMLSKIGFSESTFDEKNQSINKLVLPKTNFPNHFCNQILDKLKYAKK